MDDIGHENDLLAVDGRSQGSALHIVHIALQGCIKSGDINYGLTADTGGHIRYLLEEVRALREMGVAQSVVTRAFADERLGYEYQQQSEILMPGVTLHRLYGESPGYLPKEDIHRDLDGLADAMALWLEGLPRLPDLLHAHYADAGVLALGMRERFGIPFFFTAHSLGAVKARCLESSPGFVDGAPESMRRRIATEQRVIDRADMIVASSEDEAQTQYGLYQRSDSARPISVNPPGCDQQRFREPASGHRIEASLQRFLADPEKPILLCLARPVRKKNLVGVIDAYAQDTALRARANLVIFAGTRGAIADQEPECAEVLQAIVDRVEYHDLYGSVAFPKQHRASDVPAIYQHAAGSGGVFVNAAFNEPFGLTFIEAAAAGLPVIASSSGGARDVLGRCNNGILVDPYDGAAIAQAAHCLLDDRDRWQCHARAGQAAARYYSWQRHAQQYLRDCELVTGTAKARHIARPAAQPTRRSDSIATAPSVLLVTDMDDTLLGDAPALEAFAAWLAEHSQVRYAVATGRNASEARAQLMRWRAPVPDVLISGVGAEIHWPTSSVDSGRRTRLTDLRHADTQWASQLTARWRRNACAEILATCPALTKQPADAQGANKLSYWTDQGPDIVALVTQHLAKAGLAAQVVYSHSRFVDVLAPGGAKGGAAEHVARQLGIPPAYVVGAGNSGNDMDLLCLAGHGIAVGNCDDDLRNFASTAKVYFAQAHYAGGLIEGMHYWLGRGTLAVKTG